MSEGMDPATVLEEAADLLLIRGRCRDSAFGPNGEMCVMSAIAEVDRMPDRIWNYLDSQAWVALRAAIAEPICWNLETEDDFEVIDTLRHVAKDLRATAVPS